MFCLSVRFNLPIVSHSFISFESLAKFDGAVCNILRKTTLLLFRGLKGIPTHCCLVEWVCIDDDGVNAV